MKMNSSDSEENLLFECEYGYISDAIANLKKNRYSKDCLSFAVCSVAKGLSRKKLTAGIALDLTNQLLELGATFSECDVFIKNTPLHYYCDVGNLYLARFAIDHGANVHAVNVYGRTPLHSLSANYRMIPPFSGTIVRQLLSREETGRSFNRSDSIQLYELLIGKGANLLLKDNGGITSLWLTPVSLLEQVLYLIVDQPILLIESYCVIIELVKLLPNSLEWIPRVRRVALRRSHATILAILDDLSN